MSKKFPFFIFLIAAYLHADLTQLSDHPRIFILCQFLSDEECDYMIELARPHLMASKVVDEDNQGDRTDQRRSSRGHFLYGADPMIRAIEKRIASVTERPIAHGENLHVLHYEVGGEYQPHYDYFNPETSGGAQCLQRGGQRVASLIMYLNTPEAGGETIFPCAKISVKPRKGDAVLFYNCTPDGKVDPNSLHGGAPVKAGEKWIMTKWIRERPFF